MQNPDQIPKIKQQPHGTGKQVDAVVAKPPSHLHLTRHALVQSYELLKTRSAQFDELRIQAGAKVDKTVIDSASKVNKRLFKPKIDSEPAKPKAAKAATKPKPTTKSDDDLPLATTISNNILLVAVMEAIAVLAPDQYLSYAFGLYTLYVLLRKISSRKVFGAALLSLILVPVVTIFHRNNLADSFAVMTFYFLLIGLVRSVFELRDDRLNKPRPPKAKRSWKIGKKRK